MRARLLTLLVLTLGLQPLAADAIEYRLRVANLDAEAYFHYADRDGGDQNTPFSLRRLAEALSAGRLPGGAFVPSRDLQTADPDVAAGFQAVPAQALAAAGRDRQWREIRWDGSPGQRTVWVIRGEGLDRPAVVGVGLPAPGAGPFRHYLVYGVSASKEKVRAARVSQTVVDWSEGRDDLWRRFVGPSLALGQGPTVVVSQNNNLGFADSVFVVIEAGQAPTTYDVAIAWRQRGRGFHNPFTDGAAGGSDPAQR